MMESRIKMRISRMFRSSFGSCRTRNLSDVTEKAVFSTHNHRGFHLMETLPPKAHPSPSICRPRGSEASETIKGSIPRKKVSEWPSPFTLGLLDGRSCPPASPITPFIPIFQKEFGYCENMRNSASTKRNKKNQKKKKKKKTRTRKPSEYKFPFSSCGQEGDFGGYWWYSSDEDDDEEGEDETDTLFSSKSLSSDSSRCRRRRRCRRKKHDSRGVASGNRSSEMGVMPLQGKVKDTFAVVKRSSDPYNDFRTSMVEMIVEKRIFAPRDLENLLQCFLSLNSYNHHKIIVEVFTEIWEALFSDWF